MWYIRLYLGSKPSSISCVQKYICVVENAAQNKIYIRDAFVRECKMYALIYAHFCDLLMLFLRKMRFVNETRSLYLFRQMINASCIFKWPQECVSVYIMRVDYLEFLLNFPFFLQGSHGSTRRSKSGPKKVTECVPVVSIIEACLSWIENVVFLQTWKCEYPNCMRDVFSRYISESS